MSGKVGIKQKKNRRLASKLASNTKRLLGKNPRSLLISGGDKRDRTADLLNAIQLMAHFKLHETPQNTMKT